MSEFIDFLAKWWIPVFWVTYLLVAYYRAEDKANWLKSSAKTIAIVLVIMSPMGLVLVAAFFFG